MAAPAQAVNPAPPANPPLAVKPALAVWLHLLTYVLVVGVFVTLSGFGWVFMTSNHINDPKVYVALMLTSLFALATTTTLAIIFLWGAGILSFSEQFMNWLGGATVAEVAGILIIIVNFYFAQPTPAPTAQQTQAAQQQTDSAQPQQPPQQVQAPPKTTPAPSSQPAPQPQ